MRENIRMIMAGLLLGCLLIPSSPLIASGNPPQHHRGGKYSRGFLREIRIGLLAHDVDHLWSNMHVENGVDFNLEFLFRRPYLHLLGGDIFLNLGITVNDRGNTSKIYGGFLWEWNTRAGLFLDLGMGVAVHDGELNTPVPGKKLLGRRVLFRIPVEIGFRLSTRIRLSLMFSHVSNGYTAEYNQGLDVLGLRCAYVF